MGVRKFKSQALSKLNKIQRINAGGCGISTYSMIKWLEQNDPELLKKCVIVYCYTSDEEEAYINNHNKLRGKGGKVSVAMHIVLNVNGKSYDSRGLHDVREWRFIQHIKLDQGLDYLLETINNPELSEWNYSFDRAEQIPKIEQALGIDLSEIKV